MEAPERHDRKEPMLEKPAEFLRNQSRAPHNDGHGVRVDRILSIDNHFPLFVARGQFFRYFQVLPDRIADVLQGLFFTSAL